MGYFPLRFAVVASLLAAILMPAGFASRCCCAAPSPAASKNRVELASPDAISSLRPCCRARLAAELARSSASRPTGQPRCQVTAAPRNVAGCHCQSNARIAQTAVASRIDISQSRDVATAVVFTELVAVTGPALPVATTLPQPRSLPPASTRALLCRWVV